MLYRQDFVDLSSKAGKVARYKLREALPAFEDGIAAAIEKGETIRIKGIGTLGVRLSKARVARDPRDHSEMVIPPRYVVYFKPGARLKKAVNAYEDAQNESRLSEEKE